MSRRFERSERRKARERKVSVKEQARVEAEVGRQAYLGPSLDLSNQKVRADDGRSVEKLMCCLRVLVEPRLALLPRLGSSSLDHVRHEGPGRAAETNERHLSLEPVPRLGEGVKDVAELLVDVDVGLEASHV